MCLLHGYEYRALKSVEAILRGRRGGKIMQGMKQTGVHCMHTQKCHNETPCETIIY
jgi:hypothetical protein